MDASLSNYLKKHNIQFIEHKHPAVFTVEEAKKVEHKLPGVFHTKNLFLKDENNQFYLVCMDAFKKLDLKSLRTEIKAKGKLSFASSEKLKEHLNLTPGSVSIFGMIYAKDVMLILDKEIWSAKKVGFHPNINTATLELTHENLEKFFNSLKCKKVILEIPYER